MKEMSPSQGYDCLIEAQIISNASCRSKFKLTTALRKVDVISS